MKPSWPADHADRLTIRERLDETVIVEAAAGTGKTTELVYRMLNVLATGRARIEQIVAVTFTEKAAGELKLRVRQELEGLRQGSTEPVRSRLSDAIQRLAEAHVSTIHGFCADLLRERPVEARIDPLFQVLNEARSERVYSEAFRSWLNERIEIRRKVCAGPFAEVCGRATVRVTTRARSIDWNGPAGRSSSGATLRDRGAATRSIETAN